MINPPFLNCSSGVSQTGEPMLVQAFIPEPSVETFDKRVLDQFSRLDKVQPHAVPISPFIERLADQLRAVIDNDSSVLVARL